MAENTPPTPPAGPGDDNDPKPKPRGPFNKAQLASISKTEQICAVALKPEYLPRLENDLPADEGGISKTILEALAEKCVAARTASGEAVVATTDKEEETVDEHGDAADVVKIIRFIQARARQKHHLKSAKTLADYGIGSDILESRAALEGWAQGIYNKTATDALPKVDAAKRAELLAALKAYSEIQLGQTTAQSRATSTRSTRDKILPELMAGRMTIQFAADAEWPWTDEANHAIRMEFQLPASRPFTGG